MNYTSMSIAFSKRVRYDRFSADKDSGLKVYRIRSIAVIDNFWKNLVLRVLPWWALDMDYSLLNDSV